MNLEVGQRVVSRIYGEGIIVETGPTYSTVKFDKQTGFEDVNGDTHVANFHLHELAKKVSPSANNSTNAAPVVEVDTVKDLVVLASAVKPGMKISYYNSFFNVLRVSHAGSGTDITFRYGGSEVTRSYPPDSFVRVKTGTSPSQGDDVVAARA